MTIGGANLTGFAGVGGPYRYGPDLTGAIDVNTGAAIPDGLPDYINEGAVGLVIDDVDFGLAIMKPTLFNIIPGLENYTPMFISAKAAVGYAGLVGVDEDILSVRAEDVEVNINTFYWPIPVPQVNAVVNAGLQLFGPPSINYKLSNSFKDFTEDLNGNGLLDLGEDINRNGVLDAGEDLNGDGILQESEDKNTNGIIDPAGFMLPAGGNNGVFLDFTEEIIQAKIGYAEINLAGFVQLSASMAFTKKGSETVTLSNGETTIVTSLAIGINDANGFIGVPSGGHGYFWDSNNDGRINEDDQVNDAAVGLAIRDLDLGVVVAKELVISLDGLDVGMYMAVKADINFIGLVGVPDDVVLNAQDLRLDLNTGLRASINTGYTRDTTTGAISFDDAGVSFGFVTMNSPGAPGATPR